MTPEVDRSLAGIKSSQRYIGFAVCRLHEVKVVQKDFHWRTAKLRSWVYFLFFLSCLVSYFSLAPCRPTRLNWQFSVSFQLHVKIKSSSSYRIIISVRPAGSKTACNFRTVTRFRWRWTATIIRWQSAMHRVLTAGSTRSRRPAVEDIFHVQPHYLLQVRYHLWPMLGTYSRYSFSWTSRASFCFLTKIIKKIIRLLKFYLCIIRDGKTSQRSPTSSIFFITHC